MADTKLAILKAMINDALTELMVKTRIDNVFMTDKTTTLATKLAEIIAAINVREKIVDVDAKIEAAKSEVNQATKAEIDNITAADIGAASKEYVNEQIQLITNTGIPKLMVYSLSNVALEDNQTVFNINLDTFDVNTDTVLVQNGRTMLSPNRDFTIEDGKVVLSEGVDKDRTVEIYVFKNVPMGDEGSVSGKVIGTGSLPLDRLEELPTAEQVGAIPITKVTEENVDFNNLINEGIYNVKGTNCSHTPADDDETVLLDEIQHGFLRVFKYTSLILQVYTLTNMTAYESRSRRTYIRVSSFGSGWTTWKRFGFADEFLPLTGGMLSGTVGVLINDMKAMLDTWGIGAVISATTADGTIRKSLAIRPNESLMDSVQLEDSSSWYRLFGEHNKPSGSYTGNGQTGDRQISTGGVGSVIAIWGFTYFSIVGTYGGVAIKYDADGGVTTLKNSDCTFVDGILYVRSETGQVNANGETYYYQVL